MLKIEKTDDSSDTIFSHAVGETYHSTKGAIAEAEYIFVEMGLRECQKSELRLLEVGFGSGLNALCTLSWAAKLGKVVDYTTLELYPLGRDIYSRLNFCQFFGLKDEFMAMHEAGFDKKIQIADNLTFRKLKIDFSCTTELPAFDVCYFDAFSPEKQPEMWQEDRFRLLYQSANEGAILTTYCAKGEVRRRLQRAGFSTERLQGPKDGKREILRAKKGTNL